MNDGTERRETYSIAEPDQSLGDLIGRLTTDLGELVTDHIDLAKAEIKQDVTDAGKAAGMLGAGAISVLVAALMLSAAAALGLAEILAAGWAFLIVGAIWAALAVGLALSGKNELEDVDLTPHKTKAELERDKQWVKNRTN